MKMTSGDFNAVLTKITGPVSVTLTSGDANLSLPKNGGFTVKAKSASGDVSSPYSFADKAHKEQRSHHRHARKRPASNRHQNGQRGSSDTVAPGRRKEADTRNDKNSFSD